MCVFRPSRSRPPNTYPGVSFLNNQAPVLPWFSRFAVCQAGRIHQLASPYKHPFALTANISWIPKTKLRFYCISSHFQQSIAAILLKSAFFLYCPIRLFAHNDFPHKNLVICSRIESRPSIRRSRLIQQSRGQPVHLKKFNFLWVSANCNKITRKGFVGSHLRFLRGNNWEILQKQAQGISPARTGLRKELSGSDSERKLQAKLSADRTFRPEP